jgi:predicted nucleotidyltransferase
MLIQWSDEDNSYVVSFPEHPSAHTHGATFKRNRQYMPVNQRTSLRVSRVTPEIIETVTQRIVEAVNPRQIILFGSFARGDATIDSDLDLLIVQDTVQSDREVRRRLERVLLDRRFGLDLLVRTPAEVALNLADGNPFYTEHIFGTGIVLYDRIRQETG